MDRARIKFCKCSIMILYQMRVLQTVVFHKEYTRTIIVSLLYKLIFQNLNPQENFQWTELVSSFANGTPGTHGANWGILTMLLLSLFCSMVCMRINIAFISIFKKLFLPFLNRSCNQIFFCLEQNCYRNKMLEKSALEKHYLRHEGPVVFEKKWLVAP